MHRDSKGRFCKGENDVNGKPEHVKKTKQNTSKKQNKAKETKTISFAEFMEKLIGDINPFTNNDTKKGKGKKVETGFANFKELSLGLSNEKRKHIAYLQSVAEEIVMAIDMVASLKLSTKYEECRTEYDVLLTSLNAGLCEVEYALQKCWGLKCDEKFHSWWLRPSRCTCSRQLNLNHEQFGLGKIIDKDCPIHGRIS